MISRCIGTAVLLGTVAATCLVAEVARADDKTFVTSARTLARRAQGVARQGQFSEAARLFGSAARLDPTAWEYVYSRGRALHLDGQYAKARDAYRGYLAGAPDDHHLRKRATAHLVALEQRLDTELIQSAPPTVASLPVVRAPKPAERSGWQRPFAWVAGLVGGAAIAGGGWLLYDGWQRRNHLVDATNVPADQTIIDVSYTYAQAERSAVRSRLRLGGIVAGAGAAALVTGLVVAATGPTKAAADVGFAAGDDGWLNTWTLRF